MNMKIIKFLDKTWSEIPELENPAMHCNMIKDVDNFGALIHPECIMINKGNKEAYHITDGGFIVSRVPKEGDVIKLGVFWRVESAELFADLIASSEYQELFDGTNEALNKLTIL